MSHPTSSFSFNSGPRTCHGKHTAMIHLKIIVVEILQNYDIEVVKGHKIEPLPGFILHMKHVVLKSHLERKSSRVSLPLNHSFSRPDLRSLLLVAGGGWLSPVATPKIAPFIHPQPYQSPICLTLFASSSLVLRRDSGRISTNQTGLWVRTQFPRSDGEVMASRI
ncbi:unnamed protein product [Brassica oleracea]